MSKRGTRANGSPGDGDEKEVLELGRGDHVDLGSVSGVEDGESIALRHYAERAGTGIPSTTPGGEDDDVVSTGKARGRVGQFIDELRSYGELRRTPYGLTPAAILGGLTFFQIFDTAAFRLAGPEIVNELNISVSDIVEIIVLVGFFSIFAGIAAGYAADRVRRTPFVGIGAIISGIAAIFAGQANSFAGLATSRVIDDVGAEAESVPRFALLADYYPPENRGKVFALLGTLSRAGSLLAVFVAGGVVAAWGWRVGAAAFGIPIILMGVIALVRLREPIRGYMERKALGSSDDDARTESEPMSFAEAWRTVWGIRTLRRIFIASAIGSGGLAFSLYFSFYLAEEYGLSVWQRSLIGLPTIVTGIAGGLWGGAKVDMLTRRNPGRIVMVFGGFYVVQALGLAGIAFGPPLWVVIIFNCIFAFGFALTGPAISVVYAQVIPASIRTQGLQMTNLAAIPGFLIFAPILNRLFAEYGYTPAFLWDIPFLLIAAVIFMTAGGFVEIDARSAFAASVADQEWRRAKAAGKSKLLVCRDIDVEYSGVQVLFGVDFDVEEGETIALLGTNGAGKSTLLRAISGTQQASSGAVIFDGRDITHMPPHETAGRGVVHMPGGRGVFPNLTVRENLLLANWLTEDPDEIRTRLAEVAEIFPILHDRADTIASALSGGEQQQLSLAQAFLAKPRLLMIDELSLGLAPAVVAQLLDIVREIHRRGVTVIVVEQSVNVALTLCEKAIFMEKGEVKFFGRTADLLARPDILRAVYVKGSGAMGGPAMSRSQRDRRTLELAEARPILEVANLEKRYGGIVAVNDVSFSVREGEALGLIGPNGAGKTTIFDMISGYQMPDGGRITYDGVDVTHLPPHERAQRKLIRRFQDARLFPSLTVFETLLMALEHQLEVKSAILNAMALPQARRAERRLRDRAERLVELLQLEPYRDKFVKELSTGLRRIVDLACVLATEPRVLLLDEPSSGIAQREAESLAPLLRRIRFETGCSILIIEHDMPLISAVSDELLALERGAFVTRGLPDDVLNDERVIESYLGTTEATVRRSGVR